MIKSSQELLELMSDFKYEWMNRNGDFHGTEYHKKIKVIVDDEIQLEIIE